MLRAYGNFLAAILLISLFLCVVIEWYGFNYVPAKNAQTIEVYIPQGSSVNLVASILHTQGVLERPRAFVLMARFQNLSRYLKAGEYIIPSDITPAKLLRFLKEGKVLYRDYTLVEGWRFKQVLESMQNNRYVDYDLQHKTIPEIMAELGFPNENPEGRFFPDTFKFARGTSALVLLKKSHQLMSKELEELWQQRAANLPYKFPEDAVIVASLVEKETAAWEERSQIAGVILRRLEKNMRLQIDPTVIYALGDQYTGSLSKENLVVNSPYNTYLYKGLPPTPIAMPSKSSLYAALHPADGDAIYYVSRGNGTHEFSATLTAHNNAVKKLRQLEGSK